MKHFNANEMVDSGLYLNLRRLRFRSMDDPGRLPGAEGETYYRVPLLVLLVAGPLIGLVYVMFLPFIGIAMITTFAVRKLAAWVAEAGRAFARVARPSWRPLAAFFTRSRKAPPRRRRNGDQWSDAVKKEMANRDRDAT